jgi:hypothetical protein
MTKSVRELVLLRVRERQGRYSEHAKSDVVRLGLDWSDVISVVETASDHRREADEKKQSKWKDTFIGRDTHGRRMYITGKELARRDGKIWFVITFHEAGQE